MKKIVKIVICAIVLLIIKNLNSAIKKIENMDADPIFSILSWDKQSCPTLEIDVPAKNAKTSVGKLGCNLLWVEVMDQKNKDIYLKNKGKDLLDPTYQIPETVKLLKTVDSCEFAKIYGVKRNNKINYLITCSSNEKKYDLNKYKSAIDAKNAQGADFQISDPNSALEDWYQNK